MELLNYIGIFAGLVGVFTVVVGMIFADKCPRRFSTLSFSSLFDEDTLYVTLIGMGITGLGLPLFIGVTSLELYGSLFTLLAAVGGICGISSIITPILIIKDKFSIHYLAAGPYVLTTYLYQGIIVFRLFSEGEPVYFLLAIFWVLNIVLVVSLFIFLRNIIFELCFALFSGAYLMVLSLYLVL